MKYLPNEVKRQEMQAILEKKMLEIGCGAASVRAQVNKQMGR